MLKSSVCRLSRGVLGVRYLATAAAVPRAGNVSPLWFVPEAETANFKPSILLKEPFEYKPKSTPQMNDKMKARLIDPKDRIQPPPRAPLVLFGVAGKYATKLVEAAKADGSENDVSRQLEAVTKRFETDRQFRFQLASPVFKPAEKVALLEGLSKAGQVGPLVLELLLQLSKEKRIKLLPKITVRYIKLLAHRNKLVHAHVTSAEELSSSQLSKITAKLQSIIQPDEKLILDKSVDPSLLGGICLKLEGYGLDLSVAAQIQSMRANLSKIVNMNPQFLQQALEGKLSV
jgi:ATP synthase F1 delta subunit